MSSILSVFLAASSLACSVAVYWRATFFQNTVSSKPAFRGGLGFCSGEDQRRVNQKAKLLKTESQFLQQYQKHTQKIIIT